MRIMEAFRLASGLAMNQSKTCLVNAGANLDQENLCPELNELQWPDSFRLLGINFTRDFNQSDNNYQLPLKAINTELALSLIHI